MVIFVISFNILISLLCFYTAWRLQRWRRKLTQTANELNAWSHRADILWQAPGLSDQVLQGRQGINRWRQQYTQLQRQLLQLQQLLRWASLLPVGLRLWGQRTRSFRKLDGNGRFPRRR
ncbi:MAG TPA: hypothetical protein V6D06_05015 [Trichocoleus sp.]